MAGVEPEVHGGRRWNFVSSSCSTVDIQVIGVNLNQPLYHQHASTLPHFASYQLYNR
jgi:hypothetical protein